MKRPVVLGMVVVGGLVTMAVFGQPPQQQPQPLAIDNIATNLWRVTGAGGNTAVFAHEGGVLLVDTKLANNGQAILDQVRTVTQKPITHIINTHTHGDHTGSNMFFPASVEVVTHENTDANMRRMPAFEGEGAVGLPDETFDDRMTLFRGNDAVDLYYFGAGHTNGDAFVVFRQARVMHSGDIFATRGLPLLDTNNGGSGVAIGETLRKAAEGIDNVDRVITGHTDTLTWQDFVDYGEFNRLFLDHARTAQAAGKTAEQAAMEFTLPPKFSAYNIAGRGGRGGPAGNISIIYNELAAQ